MLLVIGDLPVTAAVGLVDGVVHGLGDLVGVHDHRAGHVARRAADRLNQRTVRAQEPFLVGVENRHQRDLRQIQALAQQVDADDDVDLALAQFAQQFDTPQRVDVGVQVLHLDAALEQIIGQILGHLLGQRGHQRAFAARHAILDLGQQVVDLPLHRPHLDLGIDQAGRADDLLDHAVGQPQLVVARRGGQVHGLADAVQELRPFERPVVHGAGQAEPVFDQRALAAGVALVHRADLRHRDMRFVDDQQEIVREEIQQGVRRGARVTPVEMPRVVLHARAAADLGEHLQVVVRAHRQALRLQLLVLLAQLGHALVQLLADGPQRALHAFGTGHIVRGREDMRLGHVVDDVAGQRMQRGDAVDLVAEELDTHGQLLVHRDDLHRVAAHAERAAGERDVVALVLHVHELAQQLVAVDLLPLLEEQHAPGVFLGRAQTVDAGDRGHHHAVAPGQQVGGGGVAQTFHIVVDVRILLDVGVGLGDVRLGLVVVVVGDEVADRVVRHQLAEFGAQLRGQRLVRLDDQRGTLQALDQPGRGGRLAGAGGAHEHHVVLAVLDARGQFLDGLRLVARRLIRRLDDERLIDTFDIEPHIRPPVPPRDGTCSRIRTAIVPPAYQQHRTSVRMTVRSR